MSVTCSFSVYILVHVSPMSICSCLCNNAVSFSNCCDTSVFHVWVSYVNAGNMHARLLISFSRFPVCLFSRTHAHFLSVYFYTCTYTSVCAFLYVCMCYSYVYKYLHACAFSVGVFLHACTFSICSCVHTHFLFASCGHVRFLLSFKRAPLF